MEPLQVKESDPLNGRPWSVQLEVGSLEQDIQKNGDSSKTDAGSGALRTAWGVTFLAFRMGQDSGLGTLSSAMLLGCNTPCSIKGFPYQVPVLRGQVKGAKLGVVRSSPSGIWQRGRRWT